MTKYHSIHHLTQACVYIEVLGSMNTQNWEGGVSCHNNEASVPVGG